MNSILSFALLSVGLGASEISWPQEILIIAFVACGLVLFGTLLAAFYHLDQLIRSVYEQEREVWESSGKPYFLFAPERLGFFSCLSWQRVSLLWPLRPPDCVTGSSQQARRLKLLRICLLGWNIGLVVLALAIAFLPQIGK